VRSDNLRPAPAWITPQMVKQVLELAAAPIGAGLVPVVGVPSAKPRLELVASQPQVPVAVAPPKPDAREQWLAERTAERRERRDALIEAERPAYQVAFDRGIALVDLARALNRAGPTVLLHTKLAGFDFGRRPPLAEALTIEQLLELTDPAVPLPELRADKLLRVRREREARLKRERRAEDVARRRADRAAAAAERKRKADLAKREARIDREIAQAKRKAAKAPVPKLNCEVEQRPARQAVRPAPSREPAPISPAARAQPLPVRRVLSGMPRAIAYAETMRAAVELLRARHFTVRRHDVNELIARWSVSGQFGLLSNEELIDLAVRNGLEVVL
jgi:hypothetical protein